MKIDTIETERLDLRGFEPGDAAFAISIWNDPEMGEYLPDPSIENADAEYLKSIETLGDSDVCCYLIAERRDVHTRIGTCSFIPSADGESYDIAYCVHKDHWKNGYATEMASGMIDYAAHHGARRITIDINRENAASNAIARKLGFKVVGERRYKKKGTDLEFCDDRYELIL